MANEARKNVLAPNEISAFCAQIAMILKSGIPVSEGISMMYEDAGNSQAKEILGEVRDEMELGATLHMALTKTGKFPKYLVDMVEIGESTGRLDDVMDSLYSYYEREQAVSRGIRNAVTYPLIMIVMMVLVILILIIKVLPIFNEVFLGLGSEMSGFSLSVMNFGQAIGRYSFVIIGVIVAVALVLVIMRLTAGGKRALDRFRASFFGTKKLYAKIASGRFASAMALMLASGLDTDQSLEMAHRLVDNPATKEKIEICRQKINEGASFSEAVVSAGIFTGVYARMITMGFKTGSLDSVMEKLATRYEEEIDAKIGGIISALEPTLVAVLSIIVGMILLSVMLPLMGIMSSIG